MSYSPILNPHPVSQSGAWSITVGAALPAGTNNIGDVDVLSLPALAAGANVIGALTANQTVSVAQIAGTATATGNGVVSAGVQRVAIASDNTAFSVNAVQSGTWNIGSITTLPSLPANQSVNVAQINGVAPLMGNGVTGTGSQRVTIASDNTAISTNATLQTGANVIGALSANQSVNVAQMNGVAVTMGTGIAGTGVQRVTLATDIALPAGTNVIGALSANQSVNVAQMNGVAVTMGSGVTGTGVQRVNLATDVPLPAGTNTLGTTTGPTLTKGTQGSTGYSTQDLKDAGRVIVNAATAIAGVTAVTAEALLSLNISRDGAATAAATSHAVTANKRWRVLGITAGLISTSAAVLSGRISLRMNPSGAATATSPIIATLAIPSGAALAQAGGNVTLMIPGGVEFSGTHQIALSQVCSAITGTVWASLIGYEY